MTRIREGNPLTTAQVERKLMHAGGQLGSWLGLARLRFRQAAQTLRTEADHMDLPESISTRASLERPELEKAEEVVEQLEQWALMGGLHMQKTIACLREDAEDIYVEAQDMSSRWKTKGESVERPV